MKIELVGVSKRFGGARALRAVSLRVADGERVGLVGPNGSGKSTLMRALMGLIACEGEVLLDGVSAFENRMEVARKLAYVPQFAPQWGALVREVVGATESLRGVPRARVRSAAEEMGLDLDAVWSRPFRDLSGGMKQKLMIALAVSAAPSLYVLDEPTASLDAEARSRFFALLERASRGATRLLCSHRSDDLRALVDRVVLLADGEVRYDGPVEGCPEQGSPGAGRAGARAQLQLIPGGAAARLPGALAPEGG